MAVLSPPCRTKVPSATRRVTDTPRTCALYLHVGMSFLFPFSSSLSFIKHQRRESCRCRASLFSSRAPSVLVMRSTDTRNADRRGKEELNYFLCTSKSSSASPAHFSRFCLPARRRLFSQCHRHRSPVFTRFDERVAPVPGPDVNRFAGRDSDPRFLSPFVTLVARRR